LPRRVEALRLELGKLIFAVAELRMRTLDQMMDSTRAFSGTSEV